MPMSGSHSRGYLTAGLRGNPMRLLPTTTEVIAPWTDFSKIPPDVLQRAADRGTDVHAACTTFAKGLPVMGLPVELRGYFDSYRRWFEQIVQEVILVEERLFDEANGYCGQIDLLVKTKQGEVVLVDLKTPIALSKSWKLQIASYRHLLEMNGYHPDRCGSLRLSPDGKIPKMDFYEGSAAQDFNIFLHALNCYRFFRG